MANERRFLYLLFHESVHELTLQDKYLIALYLKEDFPFEVKVRDVRLGLQEYYDPKRDQYYSTTILKELLLRFPSDGLKALLVVGVDLFIPILTFVFGEAQLEGKVGIVSTARLRQEFYHLPQDKPLLMRRLLKEKKRELGHTFGLVHCEDRNCVMSVAHNVLGVDAKGMGFCEECHSLLLEKFEVVSGNSTEL